jgi:hypothetical protein
MKKVLLFIAMAASMITQASTPTWSSDVACIVYSHCSSCHNPQGIAPFSLLTYADAFSTMQGIRYNVENKLMPPYLPNTHYQHYADEKTLTDQEIRTISAWVNAGGPEGDTTQAPPQPVFTTNVVLTNPDLVGKMPVYTIPFTGTDLYRCFVITNPQPTASFIKTIEVVPGNRAAVHHVLIYQDTSSSLIALDSADAGPGYTNFGGPGSNTAKLVGGWVPGSTSYSVPAGMGIKLVQGARLVIQVHYPTSAQGMVDSTRVNIQFDNTPNLRNVTFAPILNHQISMTDGPLVIPADSARMFHEHYSMPAVDVTVLSVAPHAHLICRSMKAFAVTPTGDTIPVIDIPNWDFHWQGAHPFQKPIKVPARSELYGEAYYDNTQNNPHNPNHPIQTVVKGESTSDEMMLFYFSFLQYVSGDENIIVDTTSHEAHYLNCTSAFVSSPTAIEDVITTANIRVYPNPTHNILNYECTNEVREISLTDITGKTVKAVSSPDRSGNISVGDLAGGLYFMRVEQQNGVAFTQRFIKE